MPFPATLLQSVRVKRLPLHTALDGYLYYKSSIALFKCRNKKPSEPIQLYVTVKLL